MIQLAGKMYAKNDREFVNSLFNPNGTCNGYYKRLKHGIQVFNPQKELIALITSYDRNYGVVSAIRHKHLKKTFYFYGLNSLTAEYLGLDGLGLDQIFNEAKKTFELSF